MVINPVGNCPGCNDPIAMHNENGCHVFTGDHCCDCTMSYPIVPVPGPSCWEEEKCVS